MKFVLAPLAGFTDAPFRRLCYEGGADLTYTEMVSAAGLAHGSSPTRHLMETMPGEGPVACQLFGSKESDLAYATKIASSLKPPSTDHGPRTTDHPTINSQLSTTNFRFTELNLNAGCPMTKVTREGAGSKLIENPEKIYRLLKAMTENTSLPVTLKTRLGPHPKDLRIFEILDAAVQAGAKGIIVHARFTSQMHGGETHLDLLEEVVKRSPIPVTGNGSIVDAASAAHMTRTGVAAIMIGRAALSHPDIFSSLRLTDHESRTTNHESRITNREFCQTHLSYILEFRRQLAAAFPNDHIPSEDGYASVKMHTHLFRYFNGRPGAAALRARLNSVRTLAEINDIISAYGKGRIS